MQAINLRGHKYLSTRIDPMGNGAQNAINRVGSTNAGRG